MAYLGTIVSGSLRVLNGLYANTLSGNGSGITSINASNGTLTVTSISTDGNIIIDGTSGTNYLKLPSGVILNLL